MVRNLTNCQKADGNVDNADQGNFDLMSWQSPSGYGENEETERDRVIGSHDGRSSKDQRIGETIAETARQRPDESTSGEYTSLGYMPGEVSSPASPNDVDISTTSEPGDDETVGAEEITAAAVSPFENRGELVHDDPEAAARGEYEDNAGLRFIGGIEEDSIVRSSTTAESDRLQVREETTSVAEVEKTQFAQDSSRDSTLEETSTEDMGQVGNCANEVSTAVFHAGGCCNNYWNRR